MTWLANLQRTYENNEQAVGQFERNRFEREYALIPVAHTTQSAHIEVGLNLAGELQWVRVVDKEDANTIIPCTEDSASRTSKPVPYPLFDKLLYVAGDYPKYCGETKDDPYADYMKQLREWCESPEAHPKVKSVYAYLHKGTLIEDLIGKGVLWPDTQGKLLAKWTKEAEGMYGEKPKIFKVLVGDQSAAFVRFAVEVPDEPESRLWRDPSVQQSYIRYTERQQAMKDLCYISGEWLSCVDKHASRIRGSGDKAKLISANDSTGFTYRGRFQNSREAAAISFASSQKAHNALKWLIERQGVNMGGRIFLVWGTDKLELPDLHGSSRALLYDDDEEEQDFGDTTHEEFANRIRKALNGYRYNGKYQANVIVMVLDAATTGRMAVVYYRDMDKELFLDRLQHWHESCAWLHPYYDDKTKRTLSFWGAPATRDIALAAYGSRADEKVVKGLLERMLPCIVDGQQVPKDIMRSVVNRASNPPGMEPWEWERTLSIACALVRKTEEKEGYKLELNTKSTDRSYLFGRLLAIADVLERSALPKEEKRASNALRYMNVFSRHPARTWRVIQTSLQPYQARLGTKATYHNRLLDEVISMIEPEDFNNKPLSELYLLGFGSQRHELYKKRGDKDTTAPNESEDAFHDEEEL